MLSAALSESSWRKPISYDTVRSGFRSGFGILTEKGESPITRSAHVLLMSTYWNGGICRNVPYWAWKTARSVIGNEKPKRGLTVVVAEEGVQSFASKVPPPGVPRAPNGLSGSFGTYSLASKRS